MKILNKNNTPVLINAIDVSTIKFMRYFVLFVIILMTTTINAQLKFYKKQAENGDSFSQNQMGKIYQLGEEVPQDYSLAAKWYRKAAIQNNSNAQYELGRFYKLGQGVKQDYILAAKWFEKATTKSNSKAQYELGLLYYEGKGVNKNPKLGIEWITKAAISLADAQYELGKIYQMGENVQQDYSLAAEWYEKANNNHTNCPKAQLNLGILYYEGKGVDKDSKEAIYYISKAAKNGYSEAIHHLKTLAEQNDKDAQNELGYMYGHGHGVEKDDSQSFYWYKKSAEQGRKDSQRDLANLYHLGRGVEKDDSQSFYWYKKSAEQGYEPSFTYLASLYRRGLGVEKNLEQALVWYKKAEAIGNQSATKEIEQIKEKIRRVISKNAQSIRTAKPKKHKMVSELGGNYAYIATFTCLRGGRSISPRSALVNCIYISKGTLKITKNGKGHAYNYNEMKSFGDGPSIVKLPESFSIYASTGQYFTLRLEIRDKSGKIVYSDEARNYGSLNISN